MKILIVDRDIPAREALRDMLEAQGHGVTVESTRDVAMQRVEAERFDIIAIDPSPLSSLKQMTLPLRWNQRDDYFYLILLGNHVSDEEVLRSGLNDKISTPPDMADVARKIGNAERLTHFMTELRDGEAVAPHHRIFGKKPFYQLVISALDRAYRYNEKAYMLVMRLTNRDELHARLGPEAVDGIFRDMGDYLSGLHRLSDFFGQTNTNEYTLLLLRPAVDSEPQDAADRFAMALRDFQDQAPSEVRPKFILELWSLPSADVAVTIVMDA